jgi:hypothetical protein
VIYLSEIDVRETLHPHATIEYFDGPPSITA